MSAAASSITLAQANQLMTASLALARERKLLPLTIVVVDHGGHLVAAQREDGSSTLRYEIAFGKAWSCMALGHSTRFMEEVMARNRPHFLDSLPATAGGKFVPCIGGVLIRSGSGALLGAVGVTGDTADNDEAMALHGIAQIGLVADLS